MSTTTPEGGEVEASQPTSAEAPTTEAVTPEAHNSDQVITTDDNGTPTMAPVSEAAVSKDKTEETQAEPDTEIIEWAEKKGLKIDPDNPNEVKLARLQLENDRRFHEATQKSSITPPPLLEETGDARFDPIVERQNQTDLRLYVRDWFDANPEMKDHRTELQQIATQRPYLQDMDDVKAHLLANPSREAQLKMDGGREALTNLAQKQQQIPPGANATNSGAYASSTTITPQNVFEQVESHDQEWFEKNHDTISKAIAGK